MKAGPILFLSVALNLALAIAIVGRPRPVLASHEVKRSSASDATVVTEEESRPSPAPVGALPPPFRWSQVMSNDLRVYRDNLLTAGCPRPTVRDIILGEINESFGSRRQELVAGVQGRFWNCVLRGGEQAVREEAVGPFIELKSEREKTIHALLGKGFGLSEADEQTKRESFQERFSWLPQEKQDQLYAAEEKRLQKLREFVKAIGGLADRPLTDEESRRLQAIRKESAGRTEVLTPEELEEVRLRRSNESLWAADMSGFEATREEWRTVTLLRMDAEDGRKKVLYSDLTDEERQKESEKIETALDGAIKQALGAERYAEYTRAKDDRYQGILKVTQRYGLADSVAFRAYELQRSAADQAAKVQNDASLGPDERQKSLTILQRKTEQDLANALGEKVLATYKEYGGGWIGELSQGGNE